MVSCDGRKAGEEQVWSFNLATVVRSCAVPLLEHYLLSLPLGASVSPLEWCGPGFLSRRWGAGLVGHQQDAQGRRNTG